MRIGWLDQLDYSPFLVVVLQKVDCMVFLAADARTQCPAVLG